MGIEVSACSFDPDPFCITYQSNDLAVLQGHFISFGNFSGTFVRTHTYAGDENRDTLQVWDNIPFDCNGWHFRDANYLGALGTEVIISVPQIDSIEFGYEIIGDYIVADNLYSGVYSLLVIDETHVVGNIFSIVHLDTISLDSFLDGVVENSTCGNVSTHPDELIQINIYPNPTTSYINIAVNPEFFNNKVSIYDMSGRSVLNQLFQPSIPIHTLKPGIYLIVISSNSRFYKSRFSVL